MYDFILKRGFSQSLSCGNGRHFFADLLHAEYKAMGMRGLTASAHHGHGQRCYGVRESQFGAVLSMVVKESQYDWDEHLSHVEAAFNNSINASTELVSSEVHLRRSPRVSITAIRRSSAGGHQSLGRDQFEYCDLPQDRQQRAYQLAREHHMLSPRP